MSNRPQNIALKSGSLAATAGRSCLAGTVVRSCQAKQRTCLKCGKPFDSAGPGNRICRRCAQVNARQSITEEQLQKQRGAKRHNGESMNDDSTDEN